MSSILFFLAHLNVHFHMFNGRNYLVRWTQKLYLNLPPYLTKSRHSKQIVTNLHHAKSLCNHSKAESEFWFKCCRKIYAIQSVCHIIINSTLTSTRLVSGAHWCVLCWQSSTCPCMFIVVKSPVDFVPSSWRSSSVVYNI